MSEDQSKRWGEAMERQAILAAIRATEYKYFGDYEMSADQRAAIDVLVEAAIKYLAAQPLTSNKEGTHD